MSKFREIEVRGFKVEVWDFGYAQYYYPSFNLNAEFKVCRDGFRRLRNYLGSVKFVESKMAINNSWRRNLY